MTIHIKTKIKAKKYVGIKLFETRCFEFIMYDDSITPK